MRILLVVVFIFRYSRVSNKFNENENESINEISNFNYCKQLDHIQDHKVPERHLNKSIYKRLFRYNTDFQLAK